MLLLAALDLHPVGNRKREVHDIEVVEGRVVLDAAIGVEALVGRIGDSACRATPRSAACSAARVAEIEAREVYLSRDAEDPRWRQGLERKYALVRPAQQRQRQSAALGTVVELLQGAFEGGRLVAVLGTMKRGMPANSRSERLPQSSIGTWRAASCEIRYQNTISSRPIGSSMCQTTWGNRPGRSCGVSVTS